MRHRVVITGVGWVTPLGHDVETAWRRLLAGESGVAPIRNFDARSFPTTFAAEVKDYRIPPDIAASAKHKNISRATYFALDAARQAWRQAQLPAPGSAEHQQLNPSLQHVISFRCNF